MRQKLPNEILLVELGYSDFYGSPIVSIGENMAAVALTDPKKKDRPADLVVALCVLDGDLKHGIDRYSHAAAHTDRLRIKHEQSGEDRDRINVNRAVKEEGRSLAAMTEPSPAIALRNRLLGRLDELGVKKPFMPHVLNAYRQHGENIKSARTLRRVIERNKQGIGGMAKGVPELLDEVVKKLAEAGITRF